MSAVLRVSIGQASDAGPKEVNQDFHGALIPDEPLLSSKGIALAVADGIGSSRVSGEAAQAAVKSFLTDYFCTSDAWSVKTSAHRVLAAANSWLHAQNQRSAFRYDRDRGYVCTFSGMVVKSSTAHLFHVGDSRICRLSGDGLEQLTADHRTYVSSEQSYLSRALGVNHHLEIDHLSLPLERGDVFVLSTDGLHEHLDGSAIRRAVEEEPDLDSAARRLVREALAAGGDDNLTIQLLRVEDLPSGEAAEALARLDELPLPPIPEPPAEIDGLRLLRTLHANSRSHIFLAEDMDTGRILAVKFPSVDQRGDKDYLKRLLMEEWAARRIANPHVLKAHLRARRPAYLYVAMEYVEGQSLAQWMRDNPRPSPAAARALIEQIAVGLRGFHRKEMLHQDLRPENVMIDRNGTVKIIDFGSVWVAGVAESAPGDDGRDILGTLQYTAPEYFLGEVPGPWSDVFSLGVITYQMFSGRLPYGTKVGRIRRRRDLNALAYAPLSLADPPLPDWLDAVVEKAVHPDPAKRYQDVDEFVHDLRSPGEALPGRPRRSLMDRNPLMFWKLLCAGLLLLNLLQLLLIKK